MPTTVQQSTVADYNPLEEELVCPKCERFFHDPYLLHCLHAMCRPCIAGSLAVSKTNGDPDPTISCPRCHELTVLGPDGGGIDEELKPSVMLRNAVRRYTALKESQDPSRRYGDKDAVKEVAIVCGMCESHAAIHFCQQCDSTLCDGCLQLSHRKGAFARHPIKPIMHNCKPEPNRCKYHPSEPISLYCLQCMLPVCAHCLLYGAHAGHPRAAMEAALAAGRKSLRLASEELAVSTKRLSEGAVTTAWTREELSVRCSEVVNQISKSFKELRELINAKEAEALASVKSLEDHRREALDRHESKLSQTQRKAEAIILVAEEALKEEDELAFLQGNLALEEQVRKRTQETLEMEIDAGVETNFSFRLDVAEQAMSLKRIALASQYGAEQRHDHLHAQRIKQ